MKPAIVVLTDFSPAAARARAYAAALAVPLAAAVHLVHVFSPPPATTHITEAVRAMTMPDAQQTRRKLELVAAKLSGSATAETVETPWDEAVEQALVKYEPLLLVAGLTATDGPFDEWFSNRTLPLARQTGYPVLLVPEQLPDEALHPPQRLVLAVQDQTFTLTPEARALAPLLDVLHIDVVTVTVLPYEHRADGQHGFHAAQQCGLAATMACYDHHKVVHELPAEGIQQAVSELAADGLVLLDTGHGWVHEHFNGSVIGQVLHQARVPVLLLSAWVAAPQDQGLAAAASSSH